MAYIPLQSECDTFYGNPRGANPIHHNINWEVENLVYVIPPFKMYYAGMEMKKGFRIHKKCKDSLERILNAIWLAFDKDQNKLNVTGVTTFGGSFNYRLMRNGKALSMHSWGCAIDLDPINNGLGDVTPKFANYPKIIKAFKDEGWVWGGDWSNHDGMHFQMARIK